MRPHSERFVAACSHAYPEARQRFRTSAEELEWKLESLTVDGATPDGEPLSIDVADSHSGQRLPTLLLSSGLHGVEGHLGSAVQRLVLEQCKRQILPADVRIVMIHALNPYAFAWSRRFDAQNHDLNRNFLLDGEAYSGAPELYPKLDSLLNPPVPPRRMDQLLPKAIYLLSRYGLKALEEAIAAGQYEFPRGLFYGGSEPSPLVALLKKRLPVWLAHSTRVLHLDLHTGLGPYAQPTLLQDSPLTPEHRSDYLSWFGSNAFRDVDDTSGFYQAKGSFGRWCQAHCGVEDYVYSCLDFGTYASIRVLRALRAENQSFHWAKAGSLVIEKTKRNLREVFCPSSPRWRTLALANAEKLIDNALDGLSSDH